MVIPHHLVPGGDGGTSARVGAPVQERERESESPPFAARQDGAPPPQPRGLHTVLQQIGTDSAFAFARYGGIGPSQMTTGPRFLQPTPPDGLVRPLPIPGTRSLSCAALPSEPPRRALLPRSPIPPQRRHQCGPCHRVNPSTITSILRPSKPLKAPKSRSRTKGVWGHPSPSFPAHLGCGALKRKPPPSKTAALEHTAR